MTHDKGRHEKLVKMDHHHDYSSSSSSCFLTLWPDLPADILQVIADKVHTLGILRLRAVCRSWRSSLPPLQSVPSIQFPLKLPCPISSVSRPFRCDPACHLALCETTVYRVSPLHDSSNGWLIRVEPTSKPNVFYLLDPLNGHGIESNSEKPLPQPINLLNHHILLISKTYRAEHVASGSDSISGLQNLMDYSLKKVVVASNFRKMSELLVMGLQENGSLLIWRFGDKAWTRITTSGLRFNDIISYRGTFYATAGSVGHLVKFTSQFRPIMLVPRLEYGCGRRAKLLESNGELYLVDVVDAGWLEGLQIGVYKLDDKGSYWDYELDLQGRVFFVGCDGAFAFDKEDFMGCIGNSIYYMHLDDEEEETGVFNMNTGRAMPLGSSRDYPRFYWPPPSWVYDTTTASSSC